VHRQRTQLFVQGNEAVARGAIAAGVRFFGGYPITPSSEIAEILSEELPKVGGKFIQMEDEIASIAAIIGASMAGLKSMTATSGPGFSLMQENIGLAAMLEVPCVIVNVQRGGPSTGLPTRTHSADMMQARWGSHGDYRIIALSGSSVKECFDLTIKTVNLSEQYRVPAVLLLEESIGHMRENIEIPSPDEIETVDRPAATVPPEQYIPYDQAFGDVPPFVKFGAGYRYHVTGLTHDDSGFPTSRPDEIESLLLRFRRKVTENKPGLTEVVSYMADDADILFFAYGSSARAARGTVNLARKEGLKVGLLRPIVVWPFPHSVVEKAAKNVRHIIVPELNLGQLVGEVERAAHGMAVVHAISKVSSELFSPTELLEHVRRIARKKSWKAVAASVAK
jgi:2-oxoglutarate ferredoxin oxidoreductase subunit alpha